MPLVNLQLGGGAGPMEMAAAIKIMLFMTLLSIGPALILTMTSFTRIVIVLSFLRQAVGVMQAPPNQVVIGLSLFLTFFLMSPVLKEVHEHALNPFLQDKIDFDTAVKTGSAPFKKFMVAQTRNTDLDLMMSLSPEGKSASLDETPMNVIIPAFILSELKTAFEIGFLIYLPFLLIDMVVSMILLTMGMMVLPPVLISLPFKLMLFVLVDGWNLVIGSLVQSFR